MTVDQYLQNVLFQKQAIFCSGNRIIDQLSLPIKKWGNGYVDEIFQAGSSAKGTAIKGKSDSDIFISINHSCKVSMSELFCSLTNHLICLFGKSYVRKQNVSIALQFNGYNVDLVPGKRQSGNTNYHCIYKSKKGTWTQTNVKYQTKYIINSGYANHIKLVKIWRDCHGLDFPSVNIELAVLDALKKHKKRNMLLSSDFIAILRYFSENLKDARLVDISNSNNIISNDMTTEEKYKVAKCADSCLNHSWQEIIW